MGEDDACQEWVRAVARDSAQHRLVGRFVEGAAFGERLKLNGKLDNFGR